MKKLFKCADRFVESSDWKDLAMLKFCLCAVGVLIGMSIPKERRKLPIVIASLVFLSTYIPLMGKFVKIVQAEKE